MKPRLDDVSKHIVIGDTVSCVNSHPGEESNPNIPNTVSTHKSEENKQLDPHLISGPKKHGG
jgi:hypothetical protein